MGGEHFDTSKLTGITLFFFFFIQITVSPSCTIMKKRTVKGGFNFSTTGNFASDFLLKFKKEAVTCTLLSYLFLIYGIHI